MATSSRSMSRKFLLQLLSLISSKLGDSDEEGSLHDILMFIVFFPNLSILPMGNLATLRQNLAQHLLFDWSHM